MIKEEPKIESDLQERMEGFVKELRPLLAKFELGIAAIAELTPDGRIDAKPVFVSARKDSNAEKVEEPNNEGGLTE